MAEAAFDDDERDHVGAMIAWLKDKDPDVWFALTPYLNWDSAIGVLDWIVSQPTCDKANAALVFWGAEPLYHLSKMAEGKHWKSDGFRLLDKVLKNWKLGFYKRAELGWEEDHRRSYNDTVAKQPAKWDPLTIPADLLAPLKGRKPNLPDDLRPENNLVLYDLVFALGTDVGPRPGSREWQEARDPRLQRQRERAVQRAAILADVRDRLRFWRRAAPWLALTGVVMIGGAFLLRWLNKGVLF